MTPSPADMPQTHFRVAQGMAVAAAQKGEKDRQ